MNTPYCQSCGMPLMSEEDLGTNADQGKSTEYCHYCYQNGAFTQDVTMEQMIDHCLNYLVEFNKTSGQQFTPGEAKVRMMEFFPMLKRWEKAE